MVQDNTKMSVKAADIAILQRALADNQEEFLNPQKPRANVVGMGIGVKWVKGQPTGEPALLVLVTHKQDVGTADMIPTQVEGGVKTDVVTIGYPMAGGEPMGVDIQTLTRRIRPAQGGYSVGHKDITAGTIGTCVYDFLPSSGINPPAHGIGIPSKYYILSNNHVLANSNNARIGDPILQPGPIDGGVDPTDRIATLSRFIPIDFSPFASNLVDAAIAEGQFHDLNREIDWIGYVNGWRQKKDIKVGTFVKKTGRTTNFTTGRIIAINATVNVGYGGGKVARFVDQIVTTNISAGGDSGSLVLTTDPGTCCNVAVGLLFAGSSTATIVNQIEHVRALLRVEVAEQIL